MAFSIILLIINIGLFVWCSGGWGSAGLATSCVVQAFRSLIDLSWHLVSLASNGCHCPSPFGLKRRTPNPSAIPATFDVILVSRIASFPNDPAMFSTKILCFFVGAWCSSAMQHQASLNSDPNSELVNKSITGGFEVCIQTCDLNWAGTDGDVYVSWFTNALCSPNRACSKGFLQVIKASWRRSPGWLQKPSNIVNILVRKRSESTSGRLKNTKNAENTKI